MTRPNLSDPAQRSAYRQELRRLHRWWRVAGLGLLAAAGLGLVTDPAHATIWYVLAVAGMAVVIGVILARTRYHGRRMAE